MVHLRAMSEGRTILVTGATDGIGLATARQLLNMGARVVLHGRNQPRVAAAVAGLGAAHAARIHPVSFDLADRQAVRAGAAAIVAAAPRLDAVVNNAGIFATERTVTAAGDELTWAVNVVGPHLLTQALLPALQRAPRDAVVVYVASIAHQRGTLALPDVSLASGYTGYVAYAQSKLANVMQAMMLATAQPWLRAYAVHPGVISTKLLRTGFGPVRGAPVETAAQTLADLANATFAPPSGSYISDGVVTPASARALDAGTQRALADLLATA